MIIKPFKNQILIQPITKQAVLGEIQAEYGKVIAIGEGVTKVKVDDVIGYERYGLKELQVESESLVFISEDSDFLLCILNLDASN